MSAARLAHLCIEGALQSVFGLPFNRSVSTEMALELVADAAAVLSLEPSLLILSGQFCVVGDIHGSLDSLLRVFSRFGWPPARRYLLLGDYVDRGEHSTEVILVLYSLKILFPGDVFLLRGNHECRSLTGVYGFKDEIEKIYTPDIYDCVIESFDNLPIAAILNDHIFCVHAGISPQLKSREDLEKITKPKDDPVMGIEGDLLWSDFEDCVEDYEMNEARGCGFVFGETFTNNFLKNCQFTMIIRSHKSIDGWQWAFEANEGCLTVFTAVNYMGQMNDGSVAIVGPDVQIDLHVLPAMFNDAKTKWKPLWPPWLLHESPVKGALEAALIRRIWSEPLTPTVTINSGIEINL
jgi:diadenosine tetraphosphatase ApaH/serine/threonine PP2A family protein phosphatase